MNAVAEVAVFHRAVLHLVVALQLAVVAVVAIVAAPVTFVVEGFVVVAD